MTNTHLSMFPYKKNRRPWNLLDSTQIFFDAIGITEIGILKSTFSVTDINVTNYSYKNYQTESSVRSIMLYIGNHLSYKPRNNLCI